MAVINIAAFLICLLYLSYFWKRALVDILPALTCMLVFVLYALAFIRRLSLIDGIAALIIAAFLIWLAKCNKEKRAEFGKACLENMTQASFLTALILLICVILCTSQKVVSWWDDVNFWAADVKSIYYLDGFASKYGNVSPGYGDYPPGAQLIKWWFLHFNPVSFSEGLAFAGYYAMNIIFMLPILRRLKGRNVLMMLLMALSLWLLPSVAEIFGYNGFCADLTLACVYGGFLFAVADKEEGREKSGGFYYIRLALYLGVLVLIKSVGFIWAAFGLAFFGAYQMAGKKADKELSLEAGNILKTDTKHKHESSRFNILLVFASPLIMGGSWMLFCLMMRRVTNTTATAVKYITTDEYSLSGYMGDYAKAFLEAFVKLPLHQEKSALINLTPLIFYICICLLVVFFYRKGLMPKTQGRLVLCFSILSGAVFYGIIFAAHITIFATETQYLEGAGMISSIERYGAPFTVGTLIFLANIWLEYGDSLFSGKNPSDKIPAVKRALPFWNKYGVCICFILFVALTAGYKSGYHGLIGYHNEVESQLAYREQMLDEDAQIFLKALQEIEPGQGTRVCYIQRDDEPRWVRNAYTSLEASPVSVVYKSVNLEDAPADWMVQEILDSHAFYLYVEAAEADAAGVFDGMTADGVFSAEKLYRIEEEGGKLRLLPVL